MKGAFFSIVLLLIGSIFYVLFKSYSKNRNFIFPHILWTMLLISTFIFRVRTTSQLIENPLDTAGIFRLTTILLVFTLSFVYIALHKFSGFLRKRDYLVLSMLAYLTFAAISFVYSPIPKLTLYKSFELLTEILLLLVLLRPLNLRIIKIQFDINYYILFFLIASAWFWVPFKPQEAIIRHGYLNFILRGAFPLQDADMVTVHAAILSVAAYVRSRFSERKNFYRILFIFSLTTMFFAQGRTSIVGFLVALAFIFYLLKDKSKLLLMVTLALIIANSKSIYNILYSYFLKGSSPKLITNIGGRWLLWKAGWKAFLTSPIIGHGFATGSRMVAQSVVGFLISTYNTFLEISVNTGILGLTLFSIAFFGTFFQLWKFYSKINSSLPGKNYLLVRSLILESTGIFIVLLFRATTSFSLGEHGITMAIFMSLLGLAEVLKYKKIKP